MSKILTKNLIEIIIDRKNQELEDFQKLRFPQIESIKKMVYDLNHYENIDDDALISLTTKTKKFTGITKTYDKDKECDAETRIIYQPAISLKGIKIISDAQADLLRNYAGNLILGLTELSELAAKSLAEYEGKFLNLINLEELNETIANNLSKCQCKHLRIAIRELADESAEALSNYQGHLHLMNLKNLSESAAESLSKHQGGLEVGKFHTIPEMKGRFGRNPATGEKIKIPDRPAKYLGDPLSEKSLEYLSKYNGGELSICNKWNESTLKLFANYDGDLSLGVSKWDTIYLSNDTINSSAAQLTDGEIEFISNKSGINQIELGIGELSNTAAESLSEFQGKSLSLPGVEKISDDVAEFLSQYEGHLYLNNLTELSAFAVTSLRGLGNRVQNYTFFPENG